MADRHLIVKRELIRPKVPFNDFWVLAPPIGRLVAVS